MLTMNSASARAASSLSPSGVLSTGLPAMVTKALSCPSPGVRNSSASAATGNSPSNSGKPRTREKKRWW